MVWTARVEGDEPPNEVAEWLAWVTDALPEGVKAIILLDLPLPDGVEGQVIAHGFDEATADEDILESWRRHLRAFQMNRIGPEAQARREIDAVAARKIPKLPGQGS